MEWITTETYAEMSRKAANLFAATVILKPNAVLGLATGSTPIGTYDRLVEMYKAGDVDFSRVRTVNLDEYCGLDPANDQSYRWFMNHHLFHRINIEPSNTYVPNGLLEPERACAEYDQTIERLGGVDIQLLGIGLNGHIGFNEPHDSFDLGTHVIKLSDSTRAANARFFASIDEVPKAAITVGMRTIMQAKRIVLVANGPQKYEIVKRAFEGEVTPAVPASILQLHPNITVIYSKE